MDRVAIFIVVADMILADDRLHFLELSNSVLESCQQTIEDDEGIHDFGRYQVTNNPKRR